MFSGIHFIPRDQVKDGKRSTPYSQREKKRRKYSSSDDQEKKETEKRTRRDYLRDVSNRHPGMRAPIFQDSLYWGKRESQNVSAKDVDSSGHDNLEGLSVNQLAAKAMQLRIRGKHEEVEKLLQEAEKLKAKRDTYEHSSKLQDFGLASRHVIQDYSIRKKEDADADMNLAERIMKNKQFSVSGQANEEYDFEDGPKRKSKKNGGNDDKVTRSAFAKRILTQQERCLFCFENPNRPRHLVVAIANFTYLTLPQS